MKKYHFVYKTSCAITNHYYIGVHSTDNLADGYIGSGLKFLNHVKKYGRENFYRTIVSFHQTRDDAFGAEKHMLTEDAVNDPMCLNLVEGGRGINHPYGETFKDRISRTRVDRISRGVISPAKHTEEHKQRLREDNPGGKATAKPIYQIDTSGIVVKRWASTRQAGISIQAKSWRNISALANSKAPQLAYGFYWRWVGDIDVQDGVLMNIQQLEFIRNDVACRAGKQINQYTIDGELLHTWKNMCAAARALNLDNSAISAAIKCNRPYAGFLWTKT